MFSTHVLKAVAIVVFLVLLVIGLTACSGYNSPNYLGNPRTASGIK